MKHFYPGQVIIHPHITLIGSKKLHEIIYRHFRGDWGDISYIQKQKNNHVLQTGIGSLESEYKLKEMKQIHLITIKTSYDKENPQVIQTYVSQPGEGCNIM